MVDGGSADATRALAAAACRPRDRVAARPRRADECRRRAAQGDVLVFLHADTLLPASADGDVERAIAGRARWGRFDVASRAASDARG